MGPGLAFVWPYCRVPLFTQSLTLYVFLSLNCIGLCCPWSINTISPMTSAGLFSEAFPGDGCSVGVLVGTCLGNANPQLCFLTLCVFLYIFYVSRLLHTCIERYLLMYVGFPIYLCINLELSKPFLVVVMRMCGFWEEGVSSSAADSEIWSP